MTIFQEYFCPKTRFRFMHIQQPRLAVSVRFEHSLYIVWRSIQGLVFCYFQQCQPSWTVYLHTFQRAQIQYPSDHFWTKSFFNLRHCWVTLASSYRHTCMFGKLKGSLFLTFIHVLKSTSLVSFRPSGIMGTTLLLKYTKLDQRLVREELDPIMVK